MSRSLTYFASDFHLGAACIDNPTAHERRIVDWLEREVRPNAARLYLLGDVMDFWWEYRTVAPRGFTRFIGALGRCADSGVDIVWLRGNHDIWLRDYLAKEIGMRVADGPIIETIGSKRFLLDHGDGVGAQPLGYRFLRTLFRNHIAQAAYGAIHPRWTIALAHRWSAHSRKHGDDTDTLDVVAPLRNYASGNPAHVDYYIFGHMHCIANEQLPGGCRMIVLGDWMNHASYATFDGTNLSLRLL